MLRVLTGLIVTKFSTIMFRSREIFSNLHDFLVELGITTYYLILSSTLLDYK